MSRNLTAQDRSSLIRLASTLPVGSAERKAILAGLAQTKQASGEINVPGKHIRDSAMVSENARVYDNALVFENAKVYDNAEVYDNALVYDDALVYGYARVSGEARIGGTAVILGGEWDGTEGPVLSGKWLAPGVPA